MVHQIAMFLIGFLVGVALVTLMAWLIYSKKARSFNKAISTLDLEKKQLNDALWQASSSAAALNERLSHITTLKEEVINVRKSLDEARRENGELYARLASEKTEKEKALEFFSQRISDLASVHDHMKEAFATISRESLIKNADMISSSFKQSMEHFFKSTEKDRSVGNENLASIITPLKESLLSIDKKVHDLEASRQGAYSGLKEQIDGLLKSQTNLQKETQNLSRALCAPAIRGRWGEMQLRRVVELSGLSAHCDFVEQKSLKDEGETLRPDMIVTLPKNKKIIIDAKAPLEYFGNDADLAVGQRHEEQNHELAASLRRHLLSLKKKSYYSSLSDTPEFVVMFLPGEAFLHWALLADPHLLDYAAQHEVIIATPITLVALLKAIAFGFKQEAIANNIEEVRRLSQQLIDRINKVSSHFDKLGKGLKQATECYNQTLSSLDSRVLVTARKLAEIKSLATDSSEDIIHGLQPLEISPKETTTDPREDLEPC